MFQVVTALVVAAISLSFAFTAPARADDLSNFLAQVNALRADHGLAPLAVDPVLTANAQAWSNHMASTGVMMDDPDLATQASGSWSALGENTGYSTSFGLLFDALVNSPPHLANMLGNFTLTGVAETITPQFTWLTEIFEEPGSPLRPAVAPARHVPATANVATAHPAVSVTAPPRTVAPAPSTPAPSTTVPRPTTTRFAPPTTAPPPPTTVAPAVPVGSIPLDPVPVALSTSESSGAALNAWVLVASLAGIAAITVSCWLIARRRTNL